KLDNAPVFPGPRRDGNVALRIRVLNQVLFRRDVLLRQILHALRIVLEFLFLLFDDALAQAAAAGALILRGRADRSLDRLSVRTHAHLETFLFPLLSLQTDGDALGPGVLRQLLFILRRRFLQLGDATLHIAELSANRGGKRKHRGENRSNDKWKARSQSTSGQSHFNLHEKRSESVRSNQKAPECGAMET